MDNKTSNTAKVEQASTRTKNIRPHQLANNKIVKNVFLIWLDGNIDINDTDCQNTIIELRRVANDIYIFIDAEQCYQFIEMTQDNKICMVISGSVGQIIAPCVHNMSQVHSLFIFCGNKKYHEEWSKEWPKIKGVFTDITSVCDALKQAAHQCEQNAISISFMSTDSSMSTKKLNQLEASFMYTQLMKEILLTIEFDEGHFKQFIDYCRAALHENTIELENLDNLKRNYHQKTPIWWYTLESFLYPMLNRALRTLDSDLIITLGFFIKDLHQQIERLHKEQFNSHNANMSFTVYRGQGMIKEEFKKLKQTKHGLLSFNCFLSTSKNHNVALCFATDAANNPDLVGILFVMTIDPSQSTTPFAVSEQVSSYTNDEEEIIFSMHTVFRIDNITLMNENHHLFRVDLTLTNDNDPDFRVLTDRVREETFPNAKGWYRLGRVLLKMGQFEKAEELYQILLGQTTIESEKAGIYHLLGSAIYEQGGYEKAIIFYEKAIEIYKKNLPSENRNLAAAYNDIGLVYSNLGQHSKALSSYEETLAIQAESVPPDHPHLAFPYYNIGNVYKDIGEYSKALLYHENALVIRQSSLPSNHPDFAQTYKDIGEVYFNMEDYSQAMFYFMETMNILEKTVPPNHSNFMYIYKDIGMVHEKLGEYFEACSFYERAVDIGQKTLSESHPEVQKCQENLNRVQKKL